MSKKKILELEKRIKKLEKRDKLPCSCVVFALLFLLVYVLITLRLLFS